MLNCYGTNDFLLFNQYKYDRKEIFKVFYPSRLNKYYHEKKRYLLKNNFIKARNLLSDKYSLLKKFNKEINYPFLLSTDFREQNTEWILYYLKNEGIVIKPNIGSSGSYFSHFKVIDDKLKHFSIKNNLISEHVLKQNTIEQLINIWKEYWKIDKKGLIMPFFKSKNLISRNFIQLTMRIITINDFMRSSKSIIVDKIWLEVVCDKGFLITILINEKIDTIYSTNLINSKNFNEKFLDSLKMNQDNVNFSVKECCNLATNFHSSIPNINQVAWDFIPNVNQNSNIFLEGNSEFGIRTPSMLSYLNKKNINLK